MTELSLLGRIFDNVNVVICMTKTNLNVALYGVSCICLKHTHIFHSSLKQLR